MSCMVHKPYTWTPQLDLLLIQKDLLDLFYPPIHESFNYKNWIAQLDIRTCLVCRNNHGKMYEITDVLDEEPPTHNNCRCKIQNMKAAFAGFATQGGINGADVAVTNTGNLPSGYVSKQDAIDLGWICWQGNLDKVAPGKSIGGDVYRSRNGHLPQALGRIWYEADINYDSGFRNTHRLIFSNDGLIFATYDHYKTFVQIQ